MPFKLHDHCMASLNGTYALVVGGFDEAARFHDQVYGINFETLSLTVLSKDQFPCPQPQKGFKMACTVRV